MTSLLFSLTRPLPKGEGMVAFGSPKGRGDGCFWISQREWLLLNLPKGEVLLDLPKGEVGFESPNFLLSYSFQPLHHAEHHTHGDEADDEI